MLHLPQPSNILYELEAVEVSENKWWDDMISQPKLCTYAEVKTRGDPNTLACGNLNRYNRSLIAKLLCGISPLEVETGRYARKWDPVKCKYVKIPREERYCKVCENTQVEDEYDLRLVCKELEDTRKECYAKYIEDLER